jgi:DNA-directed RNA polymerase beta' subunit
MVTQMAVHVLPSVEAQIERAPWMLASNNILFFCQPRASIVPS